VCIMQYSTVKTSCNVLTTTSQTRTEPHQSRPIDLRHLPGLRKHEILLAAHASVGRRPHLDRGHRGLTRIHQTSAMAYIDIQQDLRNGGYEATETRIHCKEMH
jgi:hypothetical protein